MEKVEGINSFLKLKMQTLISFRTKEEIKNFLKANGFKLGDNDLQNVIKQFNINPSSKKTINEGQLRFIVGGMRSSIPYSDKASKFKTELYDKIKKVFGEGTPECRFLNDQIEQMFKFLNRDVLSSDAIVKFQLRDSYVDENGRVYKLKDQLEYATQQGGPEFFKLDNFVVFTLDNEREYSLAEVRHNLA